MLGPITWCSIMAASQQLWGRGSTGRTCCFAQLELGLALSAGRLRVVTVV